MKYLILLLFPLKLFSQNNSVLFKHVNVVDVENGKIIPNQDVLIAGHYIQKISSNPVDKKGAIVVDASGKYLMPGLCDFNAYVLQYEEAGVAAFILFLANGVTSVRDLLPPNSIIEANRVKQNIASGKIVAPRLYLSGKTLIDRLPFQPENNDRSLLVSTSHAAKQAVDSMVFWGADVIDIRTILDRKILQAITKEARIKKVKVLARFSGDWMTASMDGVNAFTHPADLWRVASRGRKQLFKFSAGDSMRFVPVAEFYNRVLPSLGPVDTSYFFSLVDILKKNKTWICTNFAGHMPSKIKFEVGDTTRDLYRTKEQKLQMKEFLKGYDQITNPQTKGTAPRLYFVIEAARKGVPLLAGTQTEEFMTPGMTLHDELYWFVQSGLTPAEALQTATINPAIFLNRQKLLGTVATGKLADLVLLDANPLLDISNTRKINAVVANGRLLTRENLDDLLQKAKERVHGR